MNIPCAVNFVCAADRYLSMYYGEVEVPKRASDGYENTPTLVGMADVYINSLGHVWNKKARQRVYGRQPLMLEYRGKEVLIVDAIVSNVGTCLWEYYLVKITSTYFLKAYGGGLRSAVG